MEIIRARQFTGSVLRSGRSLLGRSHVLPTTLSVRGISTSKNGDQEECTRDKSAAEETASVGSASPKRKGRSGTSARSGKAFAKDTPAVSQSRNNGRKYALVPKVPTTEYISIADIEQEGLFAGYRPLFLGKSTLEASEYFSKYDTDALFNAIADSKIMNILKASTEVPQKRAELIEALEDLKKTAAGAAKEMVDPVDDGPRGAPRIPWDASIGGMVYSDQPFKNVPNRVVRGLKPFQLYNEEARSAQDKDSDSSNSMIVMKVHNPRINDDLEMVNPFSTGTGEKTNYYNKNEDSTGNPLLTRQMLKDLAKAREAFATEHKKMAYDHKFVNDDQERIKKEIKGLMKYLSGVFHKQSGLSVYSNTKGCLLPLHVYVQLTKASTRSTKNYLRRNIMDQVFPIYNSILAACDSTKERKQFERTVSTKVNSIVNKLSQDVPSICFTDSSNTVDCLTRTGPVPGFGRMYWLKQTKRHHTFWGHNSNKDYTLRLGKGRSVTRNGLRYMRYPNNIYWRPMKEAFDNWDYLTKV